MTTKSHTYTVQFVDCGPFGHFLPGPIVERFQRQDKFIRALTDATASLAEYRITRPQMAMKLSAALAKVQPEYKDASVPPSIDQRLGFTKYGVLQRISQDIAGTGPISGQIEVLKTVLRELESELAFFLLGAVRAPDKDSERATWLAEQAEEISRQHRASKGVF